MEASATANVESDLDLVSLTDKENDKPIRLDDDVEESKSDVEGSFELICNGDASDTDKGKSITKEPVLTSIDIISLDDSVSLNTPEKTGEYSADTNEDIGIDHLSNDESKVLHSVSADDENLLDEIHSGDFATSSPVNKKSNPLSTSPRSDVGDSFEKDTLEEQLEEDQEDIEDQDNEEEDNEEQDNEEEDNEEEDNEEQDIDERDIDEDTEEHDTEEHDTEEQDSEEHDTEEEEEKDRTNEPIVLESDESDESQSQSRSGSESESEDNDDDDEERSDNDDEESRSSSSKEENDKPDNISILSSEPDEDDDDDEMTAKEPDQNSKVSSPKKSKLHIKLVKRSVKM